MHPSIRIATVLAAVTCLAWGGVPAWAATAVALVTVRLAAGVPMAGWWRPLWRLRWLLLALCVVHLWLPASAAIEMPQRLLLAAGNVVALALAALVVDTLLLATPRDELLAGLLWLLGPLSRLGCPVERFAVRLWLTLEAIPLRQRDL